jgi:hypothetical protein
MVPDTLSNVDAHHVLDHCYQDVDSVHTVSPQWIMTMIYANLDAENTKPDFAKRVNYLIG